MSSKKLIFFLIFVSFINSCSLNKIFINVKKERHETNFNRVKFNFINSSIDIPAKVGGISTFLTYDTGCNMTTFTDSTLIDGKCINSINAKTPELKNVTVGVFTISELDLGFSKTKNKVVSLYNTNTTIPLNKKNEFVSSGYLGNDFFRKLYSDSISKIVQLSFSDSTIGLVNNTVINSLLKEYETFNCYMKRGKFFIKLKLEELSDSIEMVFDTGNQAFITIEDKYYRKLENDTVYNVYGENGTFFNGDKITSNEYYFKKKCVINNQEYNLLLNSTNQCKQNLLGINYISKFDWIIDYKNHKLYRKNITSNNILFKDIPMKKLSNVIITEVLNGKIFIKTLAKLSTLNTNNFKPGDQILKVNNEIVNEENAYKLSLKINEEQIFDLEILQ
jgi:hypothetical protein